METMTIEGKTSLFILCRIEIVLIFLRKWHRSLQIWLLPVIIKNELSHIAAHLRRFSLFFSFIQSETLFWLFWFVFYFSVHNFSGRLSLFTLFHPSLVGSFVWFFDLCVFLVFSPVLTVI